MSRGPVSTSFKPGQSGNPGGRPKLTDSEREARGLVAEFSKEAVERLIAHARGDDPKLSMDALKTLTPWLAKLTLEVKGDVVSPLAGLTTEQILALALGK